MVLSYTQNLLLKDLWRVQMYKCSNCGFECASEALLIQHQQWCGKLNEDGKPITEWEFTKSIQNKKLEKLKEEKASSEY